MDVRNRVIELSKKLLDNGLIARTWGNVSYRLDEETFAITPSGKKYNSLTIDDIVMVKIKDLSYDSPIKPSSEKGIHGKVYALNPDVNCVIHTHQTEASSLSASNLDYVMFEKGHELLNGKVYAAEYGLPGTKKLLRNVEEALKKTSTKAVLMKYHGALCYGRSDQEALEIALSLEEACKNYKKDITYEQINQDISLKSRVDEIIKGYPYCKIIHSRALLEIGEQHLDLLPVLDDFAQLTGVKAPLITLDNLQNTLRRKHVVIIKKLGAVIKSEDPETLQALEAVTYKNAEAFITAFAFGKVKPIPYFERILMRLVYKFKYSKQA